MSYVTTQHSFVIDERHPTDVFEEMSGFFSLYSSSLDSLNQVSLQLSVPKNFNIDASDDLYYAYQDFIKSVRYIIADVNVLPVKTLDDNSQRNSLQLMLQYYDRTARHQHSASSPNFYQRFLGRFIPRFSSQRSESGLYPQAERVSVMASSASAQPSPTHTVGQNNVQSQNCQQMTDNVSQHYSTPQSQPAPSSTRNYNNRTTVNQFSTLPKPSSSIKPYRDLLTKIIVAHAQTNPPAFPVTSITFKTKDSLSTAMIEMLFKTFQQMSEDRNSVAQDSIDLVSYGLEELRPKLQALGVDLAEDAKFLLNSKENSTNNDQRTISQGGITEDMLHFTVVFGQRTDNQNLRSPTNHAQNVPSSASSQRNTTSNSSQHSTNANVMNIALKVNISDIMGERTLKVREFPIVFANQYSGRFLKVVSAINTGQFFEIIEQDGELFANAVNPDAMVTKSNQSLHNGMRLMPNDVLHIGQDVTIKLLIN